MTTSHDDRSAAPAPTLTAAPRPGPTRPAVTTAGARATRQARRTNAFGRAPIDERALRRSAGGSALAEVEAAGQSLGQRDRPHHPPA